MLLGMPPKRDPKPDGLAEAPPHFHGHRDRLRARFREAGAEALADYEMLELILFRAIPQRDVKPLAKTLLQKFGSYAEVISAPAERLKEVDGVGDAAVTEFKIVQAAAQRLAKGQVSKRPVLSSWSSVLDYCRAAQAFAEKEQFRILRRRLYFITCFNPLVCTSRNVPEMSLSLRSGSVSLPEGSPPSMSVRASLGCSGRSSAGSYARRASSRQSSAPRS